MCKPSLSQLHGETPFTSLTVTQLVFSLLLLLIPSTKLAEIYIYLLSCLCLNASCTW